MGWEKWKENGKKLFHIVTTTLFTLLLPLSFLLLSRLSVANYLLSLSPSFQTDPSYSIPVFLFFQIIPTILYVLVSVMSSFALFHALTGQTTLISLSPKPVFPIYVSWFLLCTFQICVRLGMEGSVAIGVDDLGFGQEIGLMSRVVFFLGLHETMSYWWRTVVKPVVDDTVLGFRQEERWLERVALVAALGGVWWLRLRGEVETMLIMVQVKKKEMMGVGVADVIAWWLYYLTVAIGLVKFAKLIIWFAVILLFIRVEPNASNDPSRDNDEKV